MKKMIFSALAFLLVFAVKAQEIPERKTDKPFLKEKRGELRHHHEMVMKQLNLTDAQREQFKTENKNFQDQMEKLRKNEDITVRDWKAKRESIRKDHRDKIHGILTPDQKAQLEKFKTEGKARHEEMMKKRMGEMKTRLGLTDDQSAKLEKNREEMMEKMHSIREDQSLSEEKKREEIKTLMKTRKETLKSILTEEQLKKIKEGKKQKSPADDKKPEKKEII